MIKAKLIWKKTFTRFSTWCNRDGYRLDIAYVSKEGHPVSVYAHCYSKAPLIRLLDTVCDVEDEKPAERKGCGSCYNLQEGCNKLRKECEYA